MALLTSRLTFLGDFSPVDSFSQSSEATLSEKCDKTLLQVPVSENKTILQAWLPTHSASRVQQMRICPHLFLPKMNLASSYCWHWKHSAWKSHLHRGSSSEPLRLPISRPFSTFLRLALAHNPTAAYLVPPWEYRGWHCHYHSRSSLQRHPNWCQNLKE